MLRLETQDGISVLRMEHGKAKRAGPRALPRARRTHGRDRRAAEPGGGHHRPRTLLLRRRRSQARGRGRGGLPAGVHAGPWCAASSPCSFHPKPVVTAVKRTRDRRGLHPRLLRRPAPDERRRAGRDWSARALRRGNPFPPPPSRSCASPALPRTCRSSSAAGGAFAPARRSRPVSWTPSPAPDALESEALAVARTPGRSTPRGVRDHQATAPRAGPGAHQGERRGERRHGGAALDLAGDGVAAIESFVAKTLK